MRWKDEALPALHELESAIVELWRKHPDMTDYVAGRAYEGAFQIYRALNRGHQPKPPDLRGVDAEALEAIRATCERLLTSGPAPAKNVLRGNTTPVPLAKLLEYLRELHRSVERHTELGGRQGYLNFIRGFIK
jgi:hypothetical protein